LGNSFGSKNLKISWRKNTDLNFIVRGKAIILIGLE
jgi:hypothetical protein